MKLKGFINPTVGISGPMSMSPGTSLDWKKDFSASCQDQGNIQSCSALEDTKGHVGKFLKTDLNQSYFSYLERSAIVAKHELKLSIKKEGFSHQLYLEELP